MGQFPSEGASYGPGVIYIDENDTCNVYIGPLYNSISSKENITARALRMQYIYTALALYITAS